MHRNATEIFTHHFTLAGVDASANMNAELLDRIDDRLAAANGARRSIKGRQKAVTHRIDFSTAMPTKLLTNNQVMLSEEVLPCAIAKFDHSRGRANDIREKYACEHTIKIGLGFRALTSQEGFNLTENRICVSYPWIVIYAWKFDKLRPLYLPG
jgi:hypothetical protein